MGLGIYHYDEHSTTDSESSISTESDSRWDHNLLTVYIVDSTDRRAQRSQSQAPASG